jgi:4-amino-4-deoxy-L-arabinose transferase-like glycosyltransferase
MYNKRMSKSARIWLLAGILIIATFLRFYHFTSTPPGLYPDEAMDGNNATEVAQTGHFQVFYPEDNGREGLYVNIIAVFLKVWPIYEPWVIRLPAAVAGVLTVLGLYLLVAELFGYEIGLLAAFLLATSFWHINFSRIGFRAILSPLLLAWALYLFIKAVRANEPNTNARRASLWSFFKSPWLYAILAGIIYALGFYTYIAFRITPLIFLLFIPFFRKNPGFWKRAIVFIITIFIVAAPIGYYFAAHPADFFGRTAEISVTNNANPVREFAINLWKTALEFNFHGDNNWRQNISGAPELFWPVGILFIVGIILGLYVLWKKWRARRSEAPDARSVRDAGDLGNLAENGFLASLSSFGLLLTFLWFILAAIPAAASDEGIPHALRSLLMLPAALIFAAIAGMWVYGIMKRSNKKFALFVGVVFIILVATVGYTDYFIVWAQNPNVPGAFNENYVEVGRAINALSTSTPKYVVVNAGGVLARGIPVPAETTMFITDSFTVQGQTEHNIHYVLPDQTSTIPAGTPSSSTFYIN